MRIGVDASRAFVDQPTGTERYAYEIITRMLSLKEARKHEWWLYTKKGQRTNIRQNGVKVVEIPLKYLWTQGGLAYRTWIDGLQRLWIPAHTLPVLRKPGLKTAVTIHGVEYEWLPAYENWLQRWYLPMSTKYAIDNADLIIAVSEFTKSELISRLGGRNEKIKVVYEGFDPVFKKASDNSTKTELHKFGLDNKKYILFVGTVQPRKNLIRCINAFAQIKRKDLKLVICGKMGWNYEDILKAPSKFGVEDRVLFIGYVDDNMRGSLLSNCLFYIQPSITEGFGLPVLEALAGGIPVVSSNGGALKEILRINKGTDTGGVNILQNEYEYDVKNYCGLLFDPFNIEEMAQKMEMVCNNKELREKLAKSGRKAVKWWSWGKAAQNTLSLIVNCS